MAGAMGAAVHLAVGFLPVPDNRAAAVGAARRDLVDGALETVELAVVPSAWVMLNALS